MKPYAEAITGTDVKFEMVPIPGGEFVMGSPAEEAKRSDDEGPQHPVKIAPFWMGKYEVTWDEYDQFAFSLDLKKKKRDGVDLASQPAGEQKADAVTRPTPPYADETFGFGRKGQPVICITHHAAMEYCRWLSAKTGKIYRLPTEAEWEYACRAGTKTRRTSSATTPRRSATMPGTWRTRRSPSRSARRSPTPGASTTSTATWRNGAWTITSADQYKQFPVDKPTPGPVVLPDAKEYPYVARGGSWDDDADRLRSAARKSSNPEWSVQDPQRPQSIWWHTDATFVGFRVVRPLSEQENLKGLKSQVVKGKTTR